MAYGAVLLSPCGQHHTLSQATGTRGCNNEAEVLALIASLQAARALGAQALRLYSDSSIVVQQLSAQPRTDFARLAHLFEQARRELTHFAYSHLSWIPRHRNAQADALARAALGLPPKPPKPTHHSRKNHRR
jgi:ribonuclease HI